MLLLLTCISCLDFEYCDIYIFDWGKHGKILFLISTTSMKSGIDRCICRSPSKLAKLAIP